MRCVENFPLTKFVDELSRQSRASPNLLNQLVNLHLVTSVTKFEPDFYVRLLVDNLRFFSDKNQFLFVLINTSKSADFSNISELYLKKFSTKKPKKGSRPVEMWSKMLPKKYNKSQKKSMENASKYEIKLPEKLKPLDEFFSKAATVFETLLFKLSLNYRKQQIHLGKYMQEMAYIMSEGSRLDRDHFERDSVLGSIGYYFLIEGTLKYVETRTTGRSYSPFELVYFAPLLGHIHKEKKNFVSLFIKRLPQMYRVFFYKNEGLGHLEFKKLPEHVRGYFYYLGLQEFFTNYYAALTLIVRYLFVNDLLAVPGGTDQLRKTFNARSKYFNRAFFFKMNSFEDEMKAISEVKQYEGGRATAKSG